MAISYEQAVNLLITNPSDYTTTDALLALTRQVSVEASGSVTWFYSGMMPDGTHHTTDVITNLIANGEDIRVLDKTPAANFLKSDAFQSALGKIYDIPLRDMQDPTTRNAAKDWLNAPTNSPWADISQRFAGIHRR